MVTITKTEDKKFKQEHRKTLGKACKAEKGQIWNRVDSNTLIADGERAGFQYTLHITHKYVLVGSLGTEPLFDY